MTVFVESNFLLEIVFGQEESESAERLLDLAERGTIELALPSICLAEPLVTVRRSHRDRGRLVRELNGQVNQLSRSAPHELEVGALRDIPNLFASIEQRETDRLIDTVQRLLAVARLIEVDSGSFRQAIAYTARYALEIEDAIVLAVIVSDLPHRSGATRHILANRNARDFGVPGVANELAALN
jgi:predicted nucleic acid-binding protein